MFLKYVVRLRNNMSITATNVTQSGFILKASIPDYNDDENTSFTIDAKQYLGYFDTMALYLNGTFISWAGAGFNIVNGTTYELVLQPMGFNSINGSVTASWPVVAFNINYTETTIFRTHALSTNNYSLTVGDTLTIIENNTTTPAYIYTIVSGDGTNLDKTWTFSNFKDGTTPFTIDSNKTYSLTLTSASSTFSPVTVNFGLPYISISNLTITGFTVRFYNDYTSANNDNLSITGGGLTNTPKLMYVYQSIRPEPGYEVTQDYTFSSDFTPSFTLILDNNYNLTLWTEGGSVARSTVPFSIFSPVPPAPCFREGSQILCNVNGVETYRAIETLRPGMLVKTLTSGLVPITMIGYTSLANPGHSERIQNRLYKCSPKNYPTLTEDLYITGCHSILVDDLTETQKAATLVQLERIFITEDKYRLMACIDERAKPHADEAAYTIWHIALENAEYYHNYGIWANGLLVETCSKRYLKELSGMTLVM
jgi:hypothetical protein